MEKENHYTLIPPESSGERTPVCSAPDSPGLDHRSSVPQFPFCKQRGTRWDRAQTPPGPGFGDNGRTQALPAGTLSAQHGGLGEVADTPAANFCSRQNTRRLL